MAADSIIYCLESLTDYRQFERLCSDLMSQAGFPNIEPIGGASDGGRDAIFTSKQDSRTTIFAYSVRSDWKRKLFQDCDRIQEEGHSTDDVVFVCTSSISASDRDAVTGDVLSKYGWGLQLFPIERLRVMLAGELQHLVAQHPAIFCPPFFNRRGGQSVSPCRDLIVIDHVAADHALATWISRRLQLLGYRTWCLGTAPLAGEDQDESVTALVKSRAERFLSVLSDSSLNDPDFSARLAIAASIDELVIPCESSLSGKASFPKKLSLITRADFSSGWAAGIEAVVNSLAGAGVEPRIDKELGTANAVRSFVPVAVTKPGPERIFTNTFPVELPTKVRVTKLAERLDKTQLDALRAAWPYVVADGNTLLSFMPAPANVPVQKSKTAPGFLWDAVQEKYGRHPKGIVKELIWRSLDVACWEAGMQWCPDRRKFYFPFQSSPLLEVPFTHLDNRETTVALNGERTLGSGNHAKKYRYQLCPVFSAGSDQSGDWWATLRIYARITDVAGKPFKGKEIGRARKALGKSWWNKHWLARTLGMIQAIAGGPKPIVIGSGDDAVSISTSPMNWDCPIAIDYEAVSHIGDFQEEMSELRFTDDEHNGSDDEENNESGIEEPAK